MGKYCFMRVIRKYSISLLIMCVLAILMLLAVSVLAYIYKWQADKALAGITSTYILTGLIGGLVLKRMSEAKDIGKKLLEGILLGSGFMMLLVLVSMFVTDNSFEISGRFLMIWMLMNGSTGLGRIL